MDLIRITELVNQLDISSRSLRYYEQVGLIRSIRPACEKYRYYDAQTIERLRQILVLRKMQIPVKDILRIYESEDMSVVVETFVRRIDAIDGEISSLSELKRITNEFLQTMLRNGVKRISALPLLYEEMDKKLEAMEGHRPVTLEELNSVSERLSATPETSILDLAPMRVLTSKRKENGASDLEGFWDWLNRNGVSMGLPGRHELFEYQDTSGKTVMIQKVEPEFENTSPFQDQLFSGGLFAAAGVYADEDIGAFHRNMVRAIDQSSTFEVDYRHGGGLRHETLAETVLSPEEGRDKLLLYLAVKRRVTMPSSQEGIRLESISAKELERANPILWREELPLSALIPEPDWSWAYTVVDSGEGKYCPVIDTHFLSTGISVKLPFRVDVTFRTDSSTAAYGYGANEGNFTILHGAAAYDINAGNYADHRDEAIAFRQPIFGDLYHFPGLGRIEEDEYHCLSWIVGERHLAVLLDGEVRYCGVDLPYMRADWSIQTALPIRLTANGSGTRYLRKICVSQLKQTPKTKIKEGTLTMITKPSNNTIPRLHRLITSDHGENYWFNGCAAYIMESLGEPEMDYWFFSGLTGDSLTQVYSPGEYRGEAASSCRVSGSDQSYFEEVFGRCGYASTFIGNAQLSNNPAMYQQTLMAYIDKGVPVLAYNWEGPPWGVYVGYEDYGKTLLLVTGDSAEPQTVPLGKALEDRGWIFVGAKTRQIHLKQFYRDVVAGIPELFSVKNKAYLFGPNAFYAWADAIEQGKFERVKPEDFDSWGAHVSNVCNMATNGSCPVFLERALKMNPDLAFLTEVIGLYRQTGRLWNDDNGHDLEALGGGFNVTLEALQDRERRAAIAAKIREAGACMERAAGLIREGMRPAG